MTHPFAQSCPVCRGIIDRLANEKAALVEQARRAACYPALLTACQAALPAIRWGMGHQPGNMNQWRDCEDQLETAIAEASPQAR